MLISVLLLAISIAIVFSLKDRIKEMNPVLRKSLLGVLSVVIGSVLTMEFFIYLYQRILAFKEAVAGIPTVFVILVFGCLVGGAWWLLNVFLDLKLEQILKIIKEAWEKLKDTGKGGWVNLSEWWKKRRSEKKDVIKDDQLEKKD